MLSENRAERNQMEFFCIDSFVPEDHLLRKIDDAVGFGKIYEIVGNLYCRNNGRPSVDPVVLFKIVFIQHLYGIPSLRRTCEEIKMNVAYRWFLGYLMSEQLPHFSTSAHPTPLPYPRWYAIVHSRLSLLPKVDICVNFYSTPNAQAAAAAPSI